MSIDTTPKGPKAIVAQPGYPGRILLMRRAGPPFDGGWGLPGGDIEPDEVVPASEWLRQATLKRAFEGH